MPTETTRRESRLTAQRVRLVKRTKEEGPNTAEGYAAVFYDANDPGTEYSLWEDLVERIDPKAFNRAIAERQAVRCLVNHDPNYRLGRADKGTLRLTVDGKGLAYSCDIPDTQVGRDTATDLENENLDGSSFSFEVTGQKWEDVKRDDGRFLTIRTITDVDLYDVGPVAFPAYVATTAGLRSAEAKEAILAERDEWRSRMIHSEHEAVEMRSRTVQIAQSSDAT